VKKIFAVLLILLAVFVSYAPSLRDGLVCDDTALILRDPLIRSWRLIPEGFNHFLFTDATASDFYRPIQRLTYTFDYAVSAFQPGLYHLTSLICHAVAAIALLFLAEELLLALGIETRKRRLIAFVVALVWAIHPVNSSAVIYISGRADPLAALLGFLGLFLIIRGLRAIGQNKSLLLAAALLAFLLSALSKETGLIFPGLAIAFLALRRNWSDLWKVVAVAILVCATYFSLRGAAEHIPPPVLSAPAPLLVKPIVISRAIAEYAGLALFPLNLHMDRDVETNPTGLGQTSLAAAAWRELQTLLGILLLAALIYWMVRAYKRNFPVFVCLTFFIITYLPVSGISALNATVAEHWLYLPSAFLFLAVTLSTVAFCENRNGARSTITSALTLFAVWLIFLGTRTFVRTFDWKDQRTFFERTIAHGGDSARMLINLGGLELSEGKLEDAAVHFHAALQKKPEQPFAIINLAAIALKQDDFKLARELLERATKMEAVRAQAYEMLAVLEFRESGRMDLMRLRLASRTGNPQWSIEKRYVQALDDSGKRGAALAELENCLRTEWYRAETWQLFGAILQKGHIQDKAAIAFSTAHSYDVHLDAHKENQSAPAPILPSI
jgi:protein O-mannosyl-transferase